MDRPAALPLARPPAFRAGYAPEPITQSQRICRFMESAPVETPSGKWAGDENFPVGSALLPARLRPHVARFYAFARQIDDIADNPDLGPKDKLDRLQAMEEALWGTAAPRPGTNSATTLAESLVETGVTTAHATDLIAAFRQDVVQARRADWADLMDYCRLSAAPVGRYLLDLHGESRDLWPASDALCAALQVINHLQDCGEDFHALGRIYLPLDWMAEAGADERDLAAGTVSPALRRVIDRCLDDTEMLLSEARPLPRALKSRRLGAESGAILALARHISGQLRRRDPLAGRVFPGRATFLATAFSGACGGLLGRLRPGPGRLG